MKWQQSIGCVVDQYGKDNLFGNTRVGSRGGTVNPLAKARRWSESSLPSHFNGPIAQFGQSMGLLSPGFRVQVPVGLPIFLLLLLVQIQPGLKGIAMTGKRCKWFQQRDYFLQALIVHTFGISSRFTM